MNSIELMMYEHKNIKRVLYNDTRKRDRQSSENKLE